MPQPAAFVWIQRRSGFQARYGLVLIEPFVLGSDVCRGHVKDRLL